MASSRFFITILALTCFLFTSEAKEILVGGKENSWSIPPSPDFLNLWAEKTRFRIGDSLIFKFDGKTDSVLQVTRDDYNSCNKSKPIKEYKDGNTKIELSRSGAHYFISGTDGNCEKGEKLFVVVMSNKFKSSNAPASAPAPAPNQNSAAGDEFKLGFMGVITLLAGFALF
ncbi:hypothetical protein WN943_002968 [Citrus x changshan-huyou]|uniref:Phytocyanin domain-containing protein n=1 Tax=Citrus sinensis TaxID=2711 RepID=A0ACB8P919_CITSI|nr:Phytocyanin domain-containing protein [Citrus sinensis]